MKYKFHHFFPNATSYFIFILTVIVTSGIPLFAQVLPVPPDSLQTQQKQDSLLAPQNPDSILSLSSKQRFVFPNDTLSPISFQILNQRSLQTIFAEDVSDWLNELSSIFIFDPGATGQKTYFSYQGTNPRQSKLYLDNRPFFDPISGEADLTLLPMEFMESISLNEISAFSEMNSGNSAVFLRTQPFRDKVPYSQIYHHKAPRGFSDVDFRFGQQVSRRANLMVGGHIKSNDGMAGGYLYEHQNLRARINFLFSPDWRLQYSVINHSLNRNLPGYFLDGQFATPSAKQKLTRADHTFNFYGKLFGSDRENFRSAIYFSKQYSKLEDTNFEKYITDHSQYAGANFNFQMIKGKFSSSLVGEADVVTADASDFGKKSLSQSFAFLQQSWKPNKKLETGFDLGIHWQNDFDPQFSGALSQSFSPDSSWKFSLRASRTVRFPTLAEIHGRDPFQGNQALQPEVTHEIGLQIRFLSERYLKFLTSAFFKELENEIQYSQTDTIAFNSFNSERYNFFGADFGAELSFFQKFKWLTKIMFLQNCRTANLPDFSARTSLEYQNIYFQGDLRVLLRLEGRYIGKRNGETFHPFKAIKLSKELDPAIVLNFLANLKFGDLQFYLLLENILDEKYEIIYGYPMNPRSFHYGIRWEFWN